MADVQIGWYHLKEDKTFYNEYECAAWYEKVLVKAGRYPVFVYDYRITEHEDQEFNNKITGHINGAYTYMDGIIISDEFGARLCGVPISDYDNYKNAGKPSKHHMMAYLYSVADSIIHNPENPWELFPEYEAREFHHERDGRSYTTHGIFYKPAVA